MVFYFEYEETLKANVNLDFLGGLHAAFYCQRLGGTLFRETEGS